MTLGAEDARRLLAEAADTLEIPDGPHPTDDYDLLMQWSAGRLSPKTAAAVQDHLCRCSVCRSELELLTETGCLSLAPLEAGVSQEADAPEPARHSVSEDGHSRPRRRSITVITISVAAVLLAAVVYFGRTRPTQPDLALRNAAASLESNDHQSAASAAASVLQNMQATAAQHQTALTILDAASQQGARQALQAGQFDDVRRITAQAEQFGVRSAALVDLDLLARQGIADTNRLSTRTRLDRDWAWSLLGTSLIKESPLTEDRPLSESAAALKARYETALNYGEDPEQKARLRMNFAAFLIDAGRPETAAAIADEGVTAGNTDLLLTAGIAHFEAGNVETAIERFAALIARQPDAEAAEVNLAVALERAGRSAEARKHWQHILQSTSDTGLAEAIRSRLRTE